ncbi:glycosyltransferase family 4 protein, partial [Candidatus Saccharibacteria bacterium]|nr:glycosyltransferase family 4 protein [Candidatus Saccharibacteria bacterium]
EKYGGTELIIYHLIRGLKEQGHEPILLGSGDSRVDCEIIPIVDKAVFFPTHKKDIPAFEKEVGRINRFAEKKLRELLPRIDIIHSHGFDLVNFQDFPNLTTIHGQIDFRTLSYYLARKNLYYASISRNQQGALPDLQYVGVVYNGEDPSEFPIVTEPQDYVCFLGRFDREKNPHLAIQLAINLGIKIKIAGKIDHQGEGYFDEEIKPYLNHPLVEYLGELGFKEKVELLSKAKCNLHPTGFREPFGLTVLEAAYCGTPTLAIARGSMPELIEEGRTGMLVEDFVEGYHQIRECFEMDRQYIAQRARLLFNYKTMTKQYLHAYARVIKIFNTRKEQDELIHNLAQETRSGLQSIWQEKQLNHPSTEQ